MQPNILFSLLFAASLLTTNAWAQEAPDWLLDFRSASYSDDYQETDRTDIYEKELGTGYSYEVTTEHGIFMVVVNFGICATTPVSENDVSGKPTCVMIRTPECTWLPQKYGFPSIYDEPDLWYDAQDGKLYTFVGKTIYWWSVEHETFVRKGSLPEGVHFAEARVNDFVICNDASWNLAGLLHFTERNWEFIPFPGMKGPHWVIGGGEARDDTRFMYLRIFTRRGQIAFNKDAREFHYLEKP